MHGHESNSWLAFIRKIIEYDTNQQSTYLSIHFQLERQETVSQEDTSGVNH